jgi:uncharacterized protein involved in propanediol utilization
MPSEIESDLAACSDSQVPRNRTEGHLRAPKEAAPADRRRVGFGTGHGHHGEIVQGVFDVTSELSAHGLLTLPCPLFSSRVQFTPNSSGKVTAFGATRARGSPHAKTITAAELTCSFIGSAGCGGDLRVDTNIPKGKGCGSSTADVVGAIRAVADSARVELSDTDIGRIAVQAEMASDSVMFDLPVLFAQTRGVTIDRYDNHLPAFSVIGFDSAPGSTIDTLDMERPVHDQEDLSTFALLRSGLRRAIHAGDAGLLGKVASASTRIALKHKPNSRIQDVMAAAEHWGCLGVQVAHSGTIAGIMIANGGKNESADDHVRLTAEKVRSMVDGPVWTFDVQPQRQSHSRRLRRRIGAASPG